ncbi:hypothetical protein Rs2_05481 [Raphanus sativus]|nr:hypothetical protein Rs2_05481 [Raphanus sativus]
MYYPCGESDSGERSLKFLVGTTDAQKSDAKDQHEVHWHSRGVAARALHLSRGVEKRSGRVTYVVVLEGLSRFNVQELGKRGPYSVARITSLEMTKGGTVTNVEGLSCSFNLDLGIDSNGHILMGKLLKKLHLNDENMIMYSQVGKINSIRKKHIV